ncbi:hypothetical protein KUTeg_003325 [Tegillarca granosa]|uniref:DUF4371 domain-containing protein n=1 Tax=Tegillarca granosa TaxID=220873 RepID=A0ABQ9FLT7_TEGGR|nr:hypothetical protein KUTeg_003325 [Tegillarca granosa]
MKEELPFTTFPSLINLQIKNGSELKRLLSYINDKACARFATHISGKIRDEIKEKIRNADVISVMFDGATDCAVSEVEIDCEDGEVKNFLIGLEDLEHAHAEGTFKAIDKSMKNYGCENWKEKVVAMGCDGAKVNIGVHDSVATRMKDEGRDYVLAVHCIAHRLELGVLSAIKNNNYLATVQDMLNKIHKHYHYSPKALRELREIADTLDERIIKPTRLQGTRWAPHINKAIKSLCSSYLVILAHFEHVSQARPGQTTPAVVGRATYMVNKLRDWRILCFMFFMHDLLEIISILSLKFQKDDGTSMEFLDGLETANLSLIQLGQQHGEQLQAFMDSLTTDANGNCVFKNTVLTHYNANADYCELRAITELVAERINGRLESNTDPVKPILQACRIFDINDWPHDRVSLAPYGNTEIRQLSDHFSDVLHDMGCDRNQLQTEWTDVKGHFKNQMNGNQNQNIPKVNSLFRFRNRFTNIKCLIKIVLTLPVSREALVVSNA